jgi:uncharacterized membrane protein
MRRLRLLLLLVPLLLLSPYAGAEETVSRGEKIARWLNERGLPPAAAIAAISALPIVELRGAIPVGIAAFKMPWWQVYFISVVGNMLPVPFILLLLGPLSNFCMRFGVGRRFFDWLFARTRRKSAGIEKYEALGLTLFVAIPLPMTGAWTGAMAGFLMGIPFWKALLCNLLGVLLAGGIMTLLSLLGWWGAALALIGLLATAAVPILQAVRTRRQA